MVIRFRVAASCRIPTSLPARPAAAWLVASVLAGTTGCSHLADYRVDADRWALSDAPARLETTFITALEDAADVAPLVGVWTDGATRLALLPRRPRVGIDETCTLSGFIPDGPHEGAVHLARPDTGWVDEPIVGTHWAAEEPLSERSVTLRVTAPCTIEVDFGCGPDLVMSRTSDAGLDRFGDVLLVGHRGVSFGREIADPDTLAANTPRAARLAWYFGASGVELDVTLPYRRGPDGERTPAVDELRVFHPRWPAKTCDADTIDRRFETPREVLVNAVAGSGLVYVYLDIKLDRHAAADAASMIARLVTAACAALDRDAELAISLAAPVDAVASALAASDSIHSDRRDRLSWTIEWNDEMTPVGLDAAAAACPEATPAGISFMLEMIPGNRRGRDVLFRDLDCGQLAAIRRLPQRRVLWTVASREQLGAAIKGFERLAGDGDAQRQLLLMVDYPHRIAYWLADPMVKGGLR